MRLNLDIIQDHLPGIYQQKRYGPARRTLSFARPLLYESGVPLQEGQLYVARADALPRTPPGVDFGLICVGGRLPQAWLSGSIQLLLISNSSGILPVFNAVHEVYNRFDDWDGRLRDELEKESDFDIRQLLRAGAEVLGNPISVADRGLMNLFYASPKQTADGTLLVEVQDEGHYIPIEYNEKIKDVCHLERVITVPYLSAYSFDKEPHNHYCNNLYPMGYFAGCVSISDFCRPFRESDFPLMDHFFAYFQRAFLKYLRNYQQAEPLGLTALRNLLGAVPLSPAEQESLVLRPAERWVFFRLKERRDEKCIPKDYLCTTLNAMLPQVAYAVTYHEEIVGLLRLPQEDGQGSLLSAFEDITNRMGYNGGLSNTFTDLRQMRSARQQVDYIKTHLPDTGSVPLQSFQDYALQYMLDACIGELPLGCLHPQGLLALLDYDRQKGTDYVRTLDVYLKSDRSVSRTANALFIHRSSLLKRLDKINRLLDEDLDDPLVRLHYQLCLVLLNAPEV